MTQRAVFRATPGRLVRYGSTSSSAIERSRCRPRAPSPRLDFGEERLNLRSLRGREAGFVDELLQLVGRGVAYLVPSGERAAKTGVRPDVLDLLRHPGQDEEDQIVERVRGIEVAGPAVGILQPPLDLPNTAAVSRR